MEKRGFRIFSVLVDIIILTLSFLYMVYLKPASLRYYLPSHAPFFAVLALLWLIISLINGKMNRGKIINLKSLFLRVITSNIVSLGLATLIMYSIREFFYSRMVVFGTVALATAFELIAGTIFLAVRKAIVQEGEIIPRAGREPMPSEMEMVGEIGDSVINKTAWKEIDQKLVNAICREAGEEMSCGIISMAGTKMGDNPVLLSTGTLFNIESLPRNDNAYIFNLRRMNRIGHLDEFLNAINGKLVKGGYYLSCIETKNQRKKRLLKKYPILINYIIYFFDFIIHRVLAKLRITRGIYLKMSGGNLRVISRAEALGRLCRAGFRITQESFIGNLLCIEAQKVSEPEDIINPNYGVLIALNRIGRDGKLFKVYKLRTMHPYSEFLQEYVYNLHDLREGGKFHNDFRITTWGAFCRKVWLDELPMLINLFSGDMKIVGVRPLSRQYFELYDKEMQERRGKYKPGLLPPFYADMPANLEEIQASEKRYLDRYDRHPLWTDISYFFKSVWNILFRHARSN
ncbi:MAG: sugar transferase [Bacteroidales bacterium]|nr:sugar transferase [Bacteroidales bacterium]